MVKVISEQLFASAPHGESAPDSITYGNGSVWVEYGDGASSAGGTQTHIVQYGLDGHIEHSYLAAGLADGLKYNPYTGQVWVLNNNDGNASLQFINPQTHTVSKPLTYAAPYVHGANSSRGFDDVVFDGKKVFVSETNPVNPGDPVVQELLNGEAPNGKLHTSAILSFGDKGTNVLTGKLETLPITDPDSLKLLPNGSLLLTGEADHAYIFINNPGTGQQTMSFLSLPAGAIPDDAIMPKSTSGSFYISNQGANGVERVQVSGLNVHDLYADITSTNELVQIDPTNGKITPIVTGLNSPHGLVFVASASPLPHGASPPHIAATIHQQLTVHV